MKNKVIPFQINIPESDLSDLKLRLKNTKWPPPIESSNWNDGTDSSYLQNLINYWHTEYNWREREAKLNKFHHFLADIDDHQIHFIHTKGKGKNPIPLLLLQGWPSSFIQMLEIIPLLTDPQNDNLPCFDVVAASLPGYPFSKFPTKHGTNFEKIADVLTKLMVDELGYQKFAARGSDQGALVQQQMGLKYPNHLIGIHRTGVTPFINPIPKDLTEEEKIYQAQVSHWASIETPYARLQALRPETLTPALADSPAGLASWFIEKFQRWGDCKHSVDEQFGKDKLLDNLSLHWFTGAGAASIRLYHEHLRDGGASGWVKVPTAIIMPLKDKITVPAPREWAQRFYNIQRWIVMEHGGHFSEWEIPYEIANDIKLFFGELTKNQNY